MEEELEFRLLLAFLQDKKRVESDKFRFEINNDEFEGEVFFTPLNTDKFITLEFTEITPSRVKGRFIPFSLVQEKLELTEMEQLGGDDKVKSLISFMLFHLDYGEKLSQEDVDKILNVISKRTIE